MNIGIDYSSAVLQQAGIGRYTRELVKHLLQTDNQNHYKLFSFFGGEIDRELQGNQQVKITSFSKNGRITRLGFLALRLAGQTPDWMIKGTDIFHATDFAFPASKKVPSVLTIHDLAFLRYPQYFTWQNRTYMKTMAKFSARNAKAIITVSEATKADVIHYLNISESKVHAIHSGIGDIKKAEEPEVGAIRSKYKLSGDYGLFVGTIEPRKNLGLVLKGINRLKKEQKKLDFQFAVAGGKGWLYKEVFDLVKELKIQEYVKFLGFVPDEDLAALYSGAKFFVYPSVYEGFGFPPLEAMACGTPVVYADTPALNEMIGEAGLRINPDNDEELAAAITKILSDNGLAQKLISSGFNRSKSFSWAKTARKTLEVYNKVVSREI